MKKIENKTFKNELGISTLALVLIVAVIVLLILIGVTIVTVNTPSKIEKNATNEDGKQGTKTKEITLLEMYKNAEKCETENCTEETHLHIGDYVEGYTPDNLDAEVEVGKDETGYEQEAGAKQKYEVEENIKWRVLGLSKDEKHVLLTSENPIKKTVTGDEKPYLIMQGAESYLYCEDTLDKICNIYKNKELADEVRSIRIEDINRILGVKIETNEDEETIVYREDDPEKEDINGYGGFETYQYQSGDYAPENYVIDMAKKEGKVIEEITEKEVGDENKTTAYSYEVEDLNINQRIYDMLFEGATKEDLSKSYWLASPGIYATNYHYSDDKDQVQFNLGAIGGNTVTKGIEMFNSKGEWYSLGLAVRPVVVLKSNITQSQIKKSKNQNPQVEEWTYVNQDSSSYIDKGTLEGEEGKVKENQEGIIELEPLN